MNEVAIDKIMKKWRILVCSIWRQEDELLRLQEQDWHIVKGEPLPYTPMGVWYGKHARSIKNMENTIKENRIEIAKATAIGGIAGFGFFWIIYGLRKVYKWFSAYFLGEKMRLIAIMANLILLGLSLFITWDELLRPPWYGDWDMETILICSVFLITPIISLITIVKCKSDKSLVRKKEKSLIRLWFERKALEEKKKIEELQSKS